MLFLSRVFYLELESHLKLEKKAAGVMPVCVRADNTHMSSHFLYFDF